ncbi:hypothetical protein C6P42_002074 [Pichia californica]|nr:hypothetical protein C6P42_002074 [[Candida] californica]
MEDTETVNKLLSNLGEVTSTLSNKLKEDILGKTLKERIDEIVRDGEIENNEIKSELEQAKLLNMYSYILVSIYFASLKLNGCKFKNDSSIMFEIKRVKEFMDRVDKAQSSLNDIDEREKDKQVESEKFINSHLKEPAVSRVHFQDREGKSKSQSQSQSKSENQNKHEYFNDDKEVLNKIEESVKENKNKSKNKNKNKNKSFNNSKDQFKGKDKKKVSSSSKEKVKNSGKINKPKKN